MWRYKNAMGEVGAKLDEYENKAHNQDDLILALFRKYPLVPMIAPEVWTLMGSKDYMLLTSVRRSLNTLTNLGFLEVVRKRKGIYGRPNYEYKLR